MGSADILSPFATVLIVTQDRAQELARCLRSLSRANQPYLIEILVILNGENQIEPSLQPQDPPIRILRCSNRTPAAARNFGLSFARGRYICFLDDDVAVPENYFEVAARELTANPGAMVLGGPDRTFPEAGVLERSIGLALQSPLATGPTRLRHGGASWSRIPAQPVSERQLILCNLWARTDLFSGLGIRFNEAFRRNEENVLIYELLKENVFSAKEPMLLYSPELFVFHRRKASIRKFAKAVFQSGWFRAKSFVLYPGSFSPEYILPSLFLLYVLGAVFGWISEIPVLLYLAANFALALTFSAHENAGTGKILISAMGVAFYQALIPWVYGAGFIAGFFSSALMRPALRSWTGPKATS